MKKFSVFGLVLVVLLSGCNRFEKPKTFDLGSISGTTYVNSYFKVKLGIPAAWHALDISTMYEINEITVEDGKPVNLLDTETKSATLLYLSKYEDSTTEYNSNVIIMAQNMRPFPGIKTGKDYLTNTLNDLKNSGYGYVIEADGTEKIEIDGTVFYHAKTSLEYSGQTIYQSFYTTILNRFVFNIIATYSSPADEEVFLEMLDTVRFEK